MTNSIALGLGIALVAVFAADQVWFGGVLPVMLGRTLITATETIAFWR